MKYNRALSDMDILMRKGADNLTEAEARRIEVMAMAIQDYETMHYPIAVVSVYRSVQTVVRCSP